MAFASDRYCAEFGGVKLFAEEYSVSRSAAVGETPLLNGDVSLYNGGGKSVRIKLTGTSAAPCADLLENMLCSGERFTLTYGGMVFADVMLVSYVCKGQSGSSERVSAEFAGERSAEREVSE